jgi:hypothetical protein
MADRCWVEFAPAAFQSAEPLLDAWFDTEGLVVAPFAFQGELTRDPAAEFSTRPTRSGWIWAGATGSLFYWLLAWMRRGEYALYAALGVPWYGRVVMAGVESFILSAAAFVAGLLWAMLVAEIGGRVLTPDQQYLMLRTSASAILPPTALGTLSGLIVLPKRVASALKER